MTARHLFLVLYDVSSPKASAKIRNRERAKLVGELKAVMDEKTDRIHFFELDPRRLAAAVGKVRRSSIDPFLIL